MSLRCIDHDEEFCTYSTTCPYPVKGRKRRIVCCLPGWDDCSGVTTTPVALSAGGSILPVQHRDRAVVLLVVYVLERVSYACFV